MTGRVALYSEYVLAPWLGAISEVPRASGADLAAVLQLHDPFKVLDVVARNLEGSKSGGLASARKAAFAMLIRRQMAAAAVAA